MIEAIREIGEYALKKENKDPVDILNDRAKLLRTKKILAIVLERTKEGYTYTRTNVEDYSYSKPTLYRGGPPAGIDILPSSLITEPTKTFGNKIVKWLDEHKGEYDFGKMHEALKKDEENIKKDIKEKYDTITKDDKKNVLLTLKFVDGNGEKHLGEVEEFKEILKKEMAKKYQELKTIGVSKGDGYCHLCGKNGEMSGFVLPAIGLSFATADKPGFTPGLSQKDVWKSIPICSDCAFYLEVGMEFLKENLNFPKKDNNFLGFNYYVIPYFTFKEMPDDFYNEILYFTDKEYEDGLITKEDWLEMSLREKGDIVRLIFLFYTKKGGGKYIDIAHYVEDVLPSWLKRIYDTQEEVKKRALFEEENIKKILGKDWTGNFVTGRIKSEKGLDNNNWYVKFLKDFFPYMKKRGVYNKEFGDVMASILSNKPLDKDFIFGAFVREIRNTIKKQDKYFAYNFQVLCLKSLMFYLFLGQLNLFKGEKLIKGGKMDEKQICDLKGRVDALFEECGINDPELKAAFSVGMLADYLLYVQRSVRGAQYGEEPFWSKLYGLMLDERKIKNIFRESIGKLRQYQKGYPTLESIVGEYLAIAGEKWHTSKDMLSYYFALGITLGKTLKSEKVAQQEGGE